MKDIPIVNFLQQLLENRAWKTARALSCTNNQFKLRGKFNEAIDCLLAECAVLASNEYLTRHNRTWITLILAVGWIKAKGLIMRECQYGTRRNGSEEACSKMEVQN